MYGARLSHDEWHLALAQDDRDGDDLTAEELDELQSLDDELHEEMARDERAWE